MQSPSRADAEALKRCVRSLVKHPRAAQDFHREVAIPSRVVACSDSDLAGWLLKRQSTSSARIFYGKHLLRTSSTTQTVTAVSSGGAEFYPAGKAASAGIIAVSMLRDLGVPFNDPLEVSRQEAG